MASKETLGRIRHIKLITQQRRLRHLRSVSARNIVPSFPLSGDSLAECLLETFFTLHSQDSSSPAIYTSEKITYSLNPTWASFELNTLNDSLQTSVSSITVSLWGGHRDKFILLLEWKLDLTCLQYLGDQIRTTRHPPNTLIFGLVDGYYGAPVKPISKTVDNATSTTVISSLKVEMDQVVPSYNVASLQRLCSLQRAIRQTQISVLEYQQSIENGLLTTEKSMLQLAKRESLKLKVKILREELVTKVGVVKKEREEEKKLLHIIRKRERNLEKKRKDFEEKNLLLREHKQAHIDKREALVKLNAQLNMRRRQLACELTNIYPITVTRQEGMKEEYLICNVRLPDSESNEFFSTDDETLSCSLGYACHLVYMISKIMELPLRYAMNPMGSRSTITNYTLEKVAEKDKEFPLYTKGKEKLQFHFGIFLLNKNIAQLRQYFSLGTPNLRKTLPNLKDILVKRFRASSDLLKSTPSSIVEPSQINTESNSSNSITDSSPSKPKIGDVLIENMKSPVTKPPLMPKPAGLTTVDGYHSTSISTSPTKPPLPPKPSNLSRNKRNKQNFDNSENELLSVVSIRYDVTSEQDSDQRREDLQVQKLDIENNGTVVLPVDAAIKPPPHGAPHKFFEKRTKKKSVPDPAAQEAEVKSERTKKRKSLQDIRGVPVEIMRERAALQAKLNEQRNLERQAALAESDDRQSGRKVEDSPIFHNSQHSMESTSRTNPPDHRQCDDNCSVNSNNQYLHDQIQFT